MGKSRFILAGSLIDGSGAEVRRNVYLEVTDGIIADIGPAAELPYKDEAMVNDFSHCTITPALVDCSISLTQSPSIDQWVRLSTDKATMLEKHISYCQVHGVQGVANSKSITDLLECYQEGKSQTKIIDIRFPDHDFHRLEYSSTIEEIDSPSPQLSLNDLNHSLQHRDAKKTVVMANGRQQVEEALEAGCDAIEQGYLMGEDNLRKMAKNDVLWIPSVLRAKSALDGAGTSGDICCRFSQRYVAPGNPDPGAEAFWKKMLASHLAQLRLARNLGVTTAVGTGAGSIGILHGESMVEEMKLFIKAGYSLEETIRCASENGARFFEMDRLGTLTLGRHATFLISRGSAKQLPRKLSYLEEIYVEGLPSKTYQKNPVKKG